MPRISPQKRDARRDEYLRASWRCLARTGLHSVTMEEVSREAGGSEGAIYLYFPTKSELIRAAIAATLTRFVSLADIGPGRPIELIDRLLQATETAAVTPDGVDLFGIALEGWAFARSDGETRALIEGSYRRIIDTWADAAGREGRDATQARDEAETVGCIVLGFIVQRALLGSPTVAAVRNVIAPLASN